jgi:hypothetical protein
MIETSGTVDVPYDDNDKDDVNDGDGEEISYNEVLVDHLSENDNDDDDDDDADDILGANNMVDADDMVEDPDDLDFLAVLRDNDTSSSVQIPVGITIAYKRHGAREALQQQQQQQHVVPAEAMLLSAAKQQHHSTCTSTKDEKRKKSSKSKSRKSVRADAHHSTKSTKGKKKKKTTSNWSIHKSLQVLLESSLLYACCIILPPIVAFVYHTIVHEVTWDTISSLMTAVTKSVLVSVPSSATIHTLNVDPEQEGVSSTSSSYSQYYNWSYWKQSMQDTFLQYLEDDPSYHYVKSTLYEPSIQYLCQSTTTTTTNSNYNFNYDSKATRINGRDIYYTTSTASYLWTVFIEQTGLCPEPTSPHRRHRSIISEDMSIYMDVFHVMICSLCFALVRMMIVHYTIFKKRPERSGGDRTQALDSSENSNVDKFTILVRCKSNHLLSSDYDNVPATPDHNTYERRRVVVTQLVTSSTPTSHDIRPNCAVPYLDTPLLSKDPPQRRTRPIEHTYIDRENDTDHNHDHNATLNPEPIGYHIDVSEQDLQQGDDCWDKTSSNESGSVIRMNPLAVGMPSIRTERSSRHEDVHSILQPEMTTLGDVVETPVDATSTSSINQYTTKNVQGSKQWKDRDDITTNTLPSTPLRQQDLLTLVNLQTDEELDDAHHQQRRERRKLSYAAPRYATAIFRLFYCTITAGIALLYFRHADFWPWFVFGTGRGTTNCWDLSGGITVGGMDSDFDKHNTVLKRYFLWQASYHVHSTTFHFFISIIYLCYPFVTTASTNDTGSNLAAESPSASSVSTPSKRLRGIKRGSRAYARSFTQHVSSVVLIAVAYMFSSLRRLVAIGLFAFDVSSWSLHLLQICINAPDDSYLWYVLPPRHRTKKEAIIRGLYRYLVLPSFVIARFMIWPALWYSLTYESQSWLRQLEMTLWPGSALLLRCIMHALMIILHGLSILYLRRLLSSRFISYK